MKIIKINVVDQYEVRMGYYGQPMYSGSSLVQYQNTQIINNQGFSQSQGLQNQQSLINQQNQAAQYQPPIINIKTISLPIDSINHIEHAKDSNYSSIIHLKHKTDVFHCKETIEQIEKLIHNSEFNNKMDDILA